MLFFAKHCFLVLMFHSRKHIPAVFHDLMTDSESPIIDFYPTSFEIDMNGKKCHGRVLLFYRSSMNTDF